MACFVRVLQGWSEKFCPFYFGKKTNPNTTKKHAFCFVSSNFVPKSLNMTWNISSCAGSWALHWTLLIFITSNRFSEYRGTTASVRFNMKAMCMCTTVSFLCLWLCVCVCVCKAAVDGLSPRLHVTAAPAPSPSPRGSAVTFALVTQTVCELTST